MYSKILIMVLFGLMVLFQGCCVLKGTKNGFEKLDTWMQEVFW